MIGLEHYKNNILDMRNNRGMSIRQISAALSEQTGEKISSSAIFRFLKAETTSMKPETSVSHGDILVPVVTHDTPDETPCAPMPENLLKDSLIISFLENRYGKMKPPTKDNWFYIQSGMRTDLYRQFGLSRDEIIKVIEEYFAFKKWTLKEEPKRIIAARFIAPEEIMYSRPWV